MTIWLSHIIAKLPTGELAVLACGTSTKLTREEAEARLLHDYPGSAILTDAEIDALYATPQQT